MIEFYYGFRFLLTEWIPVIYFLYSHKAYRLVVHAIILSVLVVLMYYKVFTIAWPAFSEEHFWPIVKPFLAKAAEFLKRWY